MGEARNRTRIGAGTEDEELKKRIEEAGGKVDLK